MYGVAVDKQIRNDCDVNLSCRMPQIYGACPQSPPKRKLAEPKSFPKPDIGLARQPA
jgi:hypothetical protein